MQESIGGSYQEVRNLNKEINADYKAKTGTHKYESHEVIAKASFKHSNIKIRREDIPAVAMSKENHRLTKNHSHNPGFKKVQKEHTKLLNQGKFKQAWDEGIADVRSANKKGGIPENITNQGILKAEKQWLKLDKNKQLNLGKNFRKELNERQLKNQKPSIHSKNSSQNTKNQNLSAQYKPSQGIHSQKNNSKAKPTPKVPKQSQNKSQSRSKPSTPSRGSGRSR